MEILYVNINGKQEQVLLSMKIPPPSSYLEKVSNFDDSTTIFKFNDEIFLQGVFKMPIIDHKQVFNWFVWCRIDKISFMSNIDQSTKKIKNNKFSYPGVLINNLPFYDEVKESEVLIKHNHENEDQFPCIEMLTKNQLMLDQKNGISLSKVANWMEKIYLGKLGLHNI